MLKKNLLYILLVFAFVCNSIPLHAFSEQAQEIVLKKKKKKKKKGSKTTTQKSNKVESTDDFVIDFDETESEKTNHNSNISSNNKTEEKTIAIKSLGVNLPQSAYKPLIEELEKWLGTPYKYAGNSNKGIDCSGLVHHVFQNVYQIITTRRSSDLYLQCDKISEKEIQFGDLVFFKIGGSNISHVGIYLTDNKFIHASTQSGVIVSHLEEAYYKKYFFAFGRLKMVKASNK